MLGAHTPVEKMYIHKESVEPSPTAKKSNNMGAIELDTHCRHRPEGKCDSIFIIHLLGVPISCIEFLYTQTL